MAAKAPSAPQLVETNLCALCLFAVSFLRFLCLPARDSSEFAAEAFRVVRGFHLFASIFLPSTQVPSQLRISVDSRSLAVPLGSNSLETQGRVVA